MVENAEREGLKQRIAEMQQFLAWFDNDEQTNSIVRSAIAHFWFVSIHPFEDGNGRMARILSDMLLARGEKSEFRFRIVSPADARNAGGCTIFGRGFVNYNQGIKFNVIYTEAEIAKESPTNEI